MAPLRSLLALVLVAGASAFSARAPRQAPQMNAFVEGLKKLSAYKAPPPAAVSPVRAANTNKGVGRKPVGQNMFKANGLPNFADPKFCFVPLKVRATLAPRVIRVHEVCSHSCANSALGVHGAFTLYTHSVNRVGLILRWLGGQGGRRGPQGEVGDHRGALRGDRGEEAQGRAEEGRRHRPQGQPEEGQEVDTRDGFG
jgi:hypothetical protein